MWILLFACQQNEKTDNSIIDDTAILAEPSSAEDTGITEETDTSEDTDSEVPKPEDGEYVRVSGEVTWTLTFDEAAEANGFFDCSYRRTYEGEQRIDRGYLCPNCDFMTQGIATMEEGLDCHAQISSNNAAQRTELWGLGNNSFFRSGHEQRALGELGSVDSMAPDTDIALTWSSESQLNAGGTMLLEATGYIHYVVDPDITPSPEVLPHEGPYTCGWPQNDPGDLILDYNIGIDKTFPNVHLRDQCGERMSLWDFYGSWLILDTTQSDCGPCRSMAAGAEEALADMRAFGLDVVMISFLGNGLSYPYESPSQATLDSWVDTYELEDPVLFDEGFAFALFPGFVEEFTGEGFGYPTWLLINPEMKLVYGNVGFGSWENIQNAIQDNQ